MNGLKLLVMVVVVVSCCAWATVGRTQQGGAGQTGKRVGTLAPGSFNGGTPAMVCAALSSQIKKDKVQLRDVLRYLHEYRCNGDGAGTSRCRGLETKRSNLEARIGENTRVARERNCTT